MRTKVIACVTKEDMQVCHVTCISIRRQRVNSKSDCTSATVRNTTTTTTTSHTSAIVYTGAVVALVRPSESPLIVGSASAAYSTHNHTLTSPTARGNGNELEQRPTICRCICLAITRISSYFFPPSLCPFLLPHFCSCPHVHSSQSHSIYMPHGRQLFNRC